MAMWGKVRHFGRSDEETVYAVRFVARHVPAAQTVAHFVRSGPLIDGFQKVLHAWAEPAKLARASR